MNRNHRPTARRAFNIEPSPMQFGKLHRKGQPQTGAFKAAGVAGMARAVLWQTTPCDPGQSWLSGYDLSLPYHDERRYNLASKAAGALMPGGHRAAP